METAGGELLWFDTAVFFLLPPLLENEHNIVAESVNALNYDFSLIQPNLIQRQNDITALLVQQNMSSTLPPRDISIYDGDLLHDDDDSDCLHFLEQFTRGQPKELVRSCQHLPPAKAIKEQSKRAF